MELINRLIFYISLVMDTYASYIVETTLIRTELTLRLFVMNLTAAIKRNSDIKKLIREALWNWLTKSPTRQDKPSVNRTHSAPPGLDMWRVNNNKAQSVIKEIRVPEIRFSNGDDVVKNYHRLKRSLSDSRIG